MIAAPGWFAHPGAVRYEVAASDSLARTAMCRPRGARAYWCGIRPAIRGRARKFGELDERYTLSVADQLRVWQSFAGWMFMLPAGEPGDSHGGVAFLSPYLAAAIDRVSRSTTASLSWHLAPGGEPSLHADTARRTADQRTWSEPGLVFNYLPVTFEGAMFRGGVVAYESRDGLEELRQRLAASHVVLKLPYSNEVACVPYVSDAQQIGEVREFKAADGDEALVTYLLQAALVRALTGWRDPFQLSAFPPKNPVFAMRSRARDLVATAARNTPGLEGLHIFPEYTLDVRRHGPAALPGIIVGIKTRYEIDWSAAELLRRNVNLVDKYVLTTADSAPPRPFEDPRSRRRLKGIVTEVLGDLLKVTTADGSETISADQAWLEGSKECFDEVLTAVAGPSAGRVARQLEQAAFKVAGSEGRMDLTEKFGGWLRQHGPLPIALGVSASVGHALGDEASGIHVSSRRLTEPTFVFDLGGGKTHEYADRGLNTYGPYDAQGFTPKTPRIAVIAPLRAEGAVDTFVRSFADGTRDGSFAKGFIRKYHLNSCEFVYQYFDGGVRDASAYRQACKDLLEKGPRPDLAIVFVSEQQRQLSGNASPYLVAKSVLMGHGIPVQMFRLEKLKRPDLGHLLNTMSVACYAKLAGTPYVAKVVDRPMAQELVVGIGSAHDRPNRLARSERYVGITTVFTSDGHYRVSNISGEATYDTYPQELMLALRTCIEDVKARNGWQRQDRIRLIFHVFKPFKDREAQAVKKLVEDLTGQYAGVEFAFLHVADHHNWMMFDRSSNGVEMGRTRKGVYVPARGHAVRVSNSEMLISTVGPRELKTALQGAPRPLLIKLHRESTFKDLDYLAEQLFRFTALSWRRLYPSSQPVSIAYSELIASLLSQLRQVRNWNSDIISTHLRDSRWFL
ncbi:Piwi domain-containing protein [Dactylosporangium maewongense]|uniref:Protein argonaute n=1 Tax=Dactylosporangium maewongense TaxID=634393 RepID=A0ABN2DF67_9ACTN